MKSEKDLLMYYQTTLRNTGLFTTVSFAALGYSRYYRGKDKMFNVALIFASMVFMFVSISLAKFLKDDIINWKQEIKTEKTEKYLFAPSAIFIVNVCLLVLAFYTLFREFLNK